MLLSLGPFHEKRRNLPEDVRDTRPNITGIRFSIKFQLKFQWEKRGIARLINVRKPCLRTRR